MTDLAMDQDRWQASYAGYEGWDGNRRDRAETGRHAFNEDAVLTPIFHALTTGGWQERQQEPSSAARAERSADPLDEFRRDPLTAPLPVQALAALPEQPWRRATTRRPGEYRANDQRSSSVEDSGRHRRLEPARNY